MPLAGESHLDGRGLGDFFEIFFHFGEESIGVGRIKMGDKKTMGLGRDGFAEAKLGGAVTPTAAVGIFLFGVLSVADK